MRKFKGVIFDLDGTLMNTIGDIAAAGNYALGLHGLSPHSEEDYRRYVGNGVRELAQRMVCGPSGADGVQHDENLVRAVLADYTDYYAAHSTVLTRPYNGIHELLRVLAAHGLKLAVLSNKPDAPTNALVRGQLPDIPFAFVMGGRDGVPVKPDPASALMAAEAMGLEPDELVFVGDSDVDMRTAVNAGMYGVGVTWGYRTADVLQQNGARALISEPKDLLELFDFTS